MLKKFKPWALGLSLMFALAAGTASAQTYNSSGNSNTSNTSGTNSTNSLNSSSANSTNTNSSSSSDTTNSSGSDTSNQSSSGSNTNVGLPSTGAGGEAAKNLGIITSMLTLAVMGWAMTRKEMKLK